MSERIIVHGASGRMGRAVLGQIDARDDVELVAAVSRNSRSKQLITLDEAPEQADVVIDFSLPVGFDRVLAWCVEHDIALVSGTTGLSKEQLKALDQAAERIPVLWAANLSLGINILSDLVTRAAQRLGAEADVEIHDTHHRYKLDAPSGTALDLGRAVAESRDQDFDQVARLDRTGSRARRVAGEIGFSSMRAGDVVGDHTVLFGLEGERLELTHRSLSRDGYARGAIAAAVWLVNQPKGRYRMQDVVAELGV